MRLLYFLYHFSFSAIQLCHYVSCTHHAVTFIILFCTASLTKTCKSGTPERQYFVQRHVPISVHHEVPCFEILNNVIQHLVIFLLKTVLAPVDLFLFSSVNHELK